ncbi:CvpA family protein [Candidatus Pelagibacter bacterium]|jgi:membrane protein required for colicin V production|nr:CvpA family protein [Candidatus Pelagibacter bacterium]
MTDALKDFYEAISIIDLIYLVLTTLSLIKCYRKGFILSVLAASKWLLAYIVTLILFPKIKPYFKNMIDSEYVLDITLGLSIFIIVVFLMLLVNKGINKAIKYTGLGRIDSIFGLFFGFVRSFYICVAIFSAINIVYNYDRWSIDTNKSYIFPYLEKGSNYLIKEFPNEETYKNSKEKIEDI